MKRLSCLIAAVLCTSGAALAHGDKHNAEVERHIGGPADAYVYPLAEPGTYALPVIRAAADGAVLDQTGAPVVLGEVFRGRITVLAFIYTRCGDICPVASGRMADLRILASEDPTVRSRLTLASLSFDPEHDTPERMAEYAEAFGDPEVTEPEWLFLTASSHEANAPIVAAYRQPVAPKPGTDDPSGPLSHLLRVFLIDPRGMVRNIYSADFLDPRLVMNDVRTLLMEENAPD